VLKYLSAFILLLAIILSNKFN